QFETVDHSAILPFCSLLLIKLEFLDVLIGCIGRCYVCFFFFSSRRRHTRFSRDWSSDVCSSDLVGCGTGVVGGPPPGVQPFAAGGGVRLSACVRQGVGGGATTQLGAGAFQQLSELLPVFGGAPVGVVRGPVQVAGRRHRVGQRGGRPAIVVPPQERGDQVPQRVQIDRCRPGRCLRGAA